MSVEFKQSRGKYEVRWHEGGGQRSRLFERKGDADAFDLDIKRRRQLGALAPSVIQSRLTLADFVETEWWPRCAIPNLAPDTRRRYLEVWGAQLLPRVGGYELREITPLVVEDLREQERIRAVMLEPRTRVVPASEAVRSGSCATEVRHAEEGYKR